MVGQVGLALQRRSRQEGRRKEWVEAQGLDVPAELV